ncbi:transporter substrate-binding domain-containing protein [Kordiimonas sp. SCSIO 12603]|uniref:substrate-binding periplasmic protein n=1 Tax=Kordiimonas sp. SCSIO 12603 TaxID=2829596 RepID=UPI00210646C6|nr:transporter substrate-binding domain-containing protein [Kordiimonas sp. SCSIO 12603]UTW57147.1 transporter substrate-binding domain-containing protein [Kordiimonas sp. SCSIO 12603]
MIILLTICVGAVKGEEVLKVGLLTEDRPPFYMASSEKGSLEGIYIDLLNEAFAGTNVRLEFHRLPQTRLRLMMEEGGLDVEPGIDMRWRQRPQEVLGSVYSEPFMEDAEVLLFAKDAYREDYNKIYMRKLRFCGVRGYEIPDALKDYLPSEYDSASQLYVLNEVQALRMLEMSRCDYTYISKLLYRFLNIWNAYEIEVHPHALQHFQLRFRLNRKHEKLLERINMNLAHMQQSGELQRIMKRYE